MAIDRKTNRLGMDEDFELIGESGEDYLYPAGRFLMMDFSDEIRTKLLESIGEVA